MKRGLFLAVALGIAFVCSGCTRKYVVTFRNGTQVLTAGKPKKQRDGTLLLKDTAGRTARVPEVMVREVAPASMANEDAPQWSKPAK